MVTSRSTGNQASRYILYGSKNKIVRLSQSLGTFDNITNCVYTLSYFPSLESRVSSLSRLLLSPSDVSGSQHTHSSWDDSALPSIRRNGVTSMLEDHLITYFYPPIISVGQLPHENVWPGHHTQAVVSRSLGIDSLEWWERHRLSGYVAKFWNRIITYYNDIM